MGQNGHRQGIYKLQILERVWRKDSPPILLAKIWIDAGIMENSMEVSYETRNRPYYTIWPTSYFWVYTYKRWKL